MGLYQVESEHCTLYTTRPWSLENLKKCSSEAFNEIDGDKLERVTKQFQERLQLSNSEKNGDHIDASE